MKLFLNYFQIAIVFIKPSPYYCITKKRKKMTKQFTPGQKVKTCYGDIETVRYVIGDRVFTYQSINAWYHPDKLTTI